MKSKTSESKKIAIKTANKKTMPGSLWLDIN
jgi:hypothetical protein